nr:helix-turn-helix domain-containing protein [Candidatus Sigynarchaeota archaeon]
MSLKEIFMELFNRLGFSEDEVKVYIGYLGMPQATVSQIMSLLEMDYDKVKAITDKLEKEKFLKKIEGIIERYVPLEPYFNLNIKQSKFFRDEISLIKDNVLADQSAKYDDLDAIASKAKKNMNNREQDIIDDAIQRVKDSIADFTLTFMNKIDDAFALAETTEEKFSEVQSAAKAVRPIDPIKTCFLIGKAGLITYLKDVIWRTKSSIIIVTPTVVPEILELLAQVAYERKTQKFFLVTHWDLDTYGDIVRKLSALGNLQCRQLKAIGEYWAVTRDAEEIMLAPETRTDSDLVCMISTQEGYAKLYSQFIGPMFQANSMPLKM